MIRFLLDFQTTDIIVLAENTIEKVDFYHVADFLGIGRNDEGHYQASVRDIFKELLIYWRNLVAPEPDDEFLIYDLSDQYIGAFHVEKYDFKGRKYVRISKKWTQELQGAGVSESVSLSELKNIAWEKDDNFFMQGNYKTILRGIDWSLENLRINTNPVSI